MHTLCAILKHAVVSAAEAEVGALFINTKEGKVMRLTLAETGHAQPPTPTHTCNTKSNDIANSTININIHVPWT
jgi:hypothetical protein